MPKSTFYNLPADKKETLIRALKEEFSRTSLPDASISNIVNAAGIPRGSFYQYFEDKEDAYFYIFSDFVCGMNQRMMSFLQEHDGDLFDAMIDLFQSVIENEEHFDMLKMSFLNMNYKIERKFSGIFTRIDADESYQEISSLMDRTKLNVSSDHDLYVLIQIVTSVTVRCFIEKYAKEMPVHEALENYIATLNLLKVGLAKSTEERD